MDCIEEFEKKYYDKIYKLLRKETTQKRLKESLKKLNENLTIVKNYEKDNIIDMPIQEQFRMILMEYAINQRWKGTTLPASSDIFFETVDCFLMIDVKTVKMTDPKDTKELVKGLGETHVTSASTNRTKRNTLRKKLLTICKGEINNDKAYSLLIQVEPNQSTYPNKKTGTGPPYKSSKYKWAKGSRWIGPNFIKTSIEGKPILTFFISIIWEFENVTKIQKAKKTVIICSVLSSIPNGELYDRYKEMLVGFKSYHH